MGLGQQLTDAVVRERRRRLLGEEMLAAVRRPTRAQLSATLASTAISEKRGLEPLRPTNALHFTMEVPGKLGNMSDESSVHHNPVEVEVLHCSNAPSETESPPHGLLTGVTLMYGERQTHRCVDITTSEEVVGLQQVEQQSGGRLCPGPKAEQDDVSYFVAQVEGSLCSNGVSEGHRPHAQITSAALVDGGCQTTHHCAVPATSQEPRAPETLMAVPGFNTSAVQRSSFAVAATGKNMMEDTLIQHSHGMRGPAEQEDANATPIDSNANNSMIMPIFVRHGSGVLTFTVSTQESTNDLMQSYSKRTKTKLDSQYFVYEGKRIESHYSWLSYHIKRDSTVHVCTRLLGGANHPNLQDYINNNKQKFVREVPLPDGRISLQMTILGCRFLSSWINCFTTTFSAKRSWDGGFQLVDFIFAEGHVRPNPEKKPWKYTNKPGAVGADILKFANSVESILSFTDRPNVISHHPPYVQACMNIVRGLVVSGAPPPLSDVKGDFPEGYKLLLDTLVCCMTSYARERLIIELFRKYEGADANDEPLWDSAIKGADCPSTWRTDLCTNENAIFKHFITRKNNTGQPYTNDRIGAFTLLRDVVMHAADRSQNPSAPKAGDGIELTIPATLHNFLPSIIKNLIEKKIDIRAELSAAISCSCNICDASIDGLEGTS